MNNKVFSRGSRYRFRPSKAASINTCRWHPSCRWSLARRGSYPDCAFSVPGPCLRL